MACSVVVEDAAVGTAPRLCLSGLARCGLATLPTCGFLVRGCAALTGVATEPDFSSHRGSTHRVSLRSVRPAPSTSPCPSAPHIASRSRRTVAYRASRPPGSNDWCCLPDRYGRARNARTRFSQSGRWPSSRSTPGSVAPEFEAGRPLRRDAWVTPISGLSETRAGSRARRTAESSPGLNGHTTHRVCAGRSFPSVVQGLSPAVSWPLGASSIRALSHPRVDGA